MTAPGGDPDRPGQLRGRPRHLARCPGHPGRRLRADPVEHRRRPGIASALGASPLQTIYDPAIQETQIATALVELRHQLHHQPALGPQRRPVQQRDLRRHVPRRGRGSRSSSTRTPRQFQTGLQKRTATGALLGVTHNINYLYSNSPTNVTPSAYTTNTPVQPDPAVARQRPAGRRPGRPAGRPRGQPGADRRSPGSTPTPRSGGSRPRSWPTSARSSSSTGASPSSTSSSGAARRPSSWPRRSSSASSPSWRSAAAPWPTSPRRSSGSNSSGSTW